MHMNANSAHQYWIMSIVYNLSFVLMINWKLPDYRNERNSVRSACVSVIRPIAYPQPWFKRRIFYLFVLFCKCFNILKRLRTLFLWYHQVHSRQGFMGSNYCAISYYYLYFSETSIKHPWSIVAFSTNLEEN